MRYLHDPTDLGLLKESKEKLDEMIAALHETDGKTSREPGTLLKKEKKPISVFPNDGGQKRATASRK